MTFEFILYKRMQYLWTRVHCGSFEFLHTYFPELFYSTFTSKYVTSGVVHFKIKKIVGSSYTPLSYDMVRTKWLQINLVLNEMTID